MNTIGLKWGTLKRWNVKDEAALQALHRYFAEPVPESAMLRTDTPTQKQAICDAIDAVFAAGGRVFNDWEDTDYENAEAAKRYVMEYGR